MSLRSFRSLLLTISLAAAPCLARQDVGICATGSTTPQERLFLHRQSVRARVGMLRPRAAAPFVNRDIGDIAVIEDSDGVVARQNQFNLDGKTLRFTPVAGGTTRYRYAVLDSVYDAAAAASGTALAALDDDDSRSVALPFAFPFFGTRYTSMFVNSDGNLTFTAGDSASTVRSLGRMTAGPPRIAPLFDDLDPSRTAGGVRVLAEPGRVVVSWVAVPEWQTSGIGPRQTFQVTLYPDGRIEFSYSGVNATNAVVGIAPGELRGGTSLVDFFSEASGEYEGTVAERFGNTLAIDIVTLAQQFYRTHEDAYDYLVIFNNMDLPAAPGAVAYESTVRNAATGFGVEMNDDGRQYGSASRLMAMLNMGPLSQYPSDPRALVSSRAQAGDTPLTVLGHEAGHLFLAFTSVRDPDNPQARPMLGYQSAHWSFLFNSEASLLEGERILDRGPGVSPRFLTTDTVQGFAPLDQYLMGLRAPAEVPDTFYVANASPSLQNLHPVRGFPIDGTRRDVTIGEIVEAMGRRTPDHTVAQRRFRFAFILLVSEGTQPSAADLAKLDSFRREFEPFFVGASSERATAETSLRRSLKLSLSPAAGVVAGGQGTAAVRVQTPLAAALTVQLRASGGNARLPQSVTIPAGAVSASFDYTGVRAGVEEVSALPSDPAYETAAARVQVADASMLRLSVVSGGRQIAQGGAPLPAPVVVRLTDHNGLLYPGARIVARASAGGSVTPEAAAASADGTASFTWTPGTAASNELRLSVEAAPAVETTVRAGSAVPVVAAVVNAASFENGVAAGAIQTIFGANLAGGRVLLGGVEVPVVFTSDTQVNFYVPAETPLGPATLKVVTPSGGEAPASVVVASVLPGIFSDAVVRAGTGLSAASSPVRAGDYIEIYATGLGPTQLVAGQRRTVSTPTVFFGPTPVTASFSGLAPGFQGLYQVNVQVPTGLSAGPVTLTLSINLAHSNQVQIAAQ